MMSRVDRMRGGRTWPALACAAALALFAAATPAQAATSDPLFLFVPKPPPGGEAVPPPTGSFNGPCGLGVDPASDLYVSDYYHGAVDVFDSSTTYKAQLAEADPLGGPCGLAFDAAGGLYLNNYHRNVVAFSPFPAFGTGTVLAGAPLDETRPTGLAVDPATGDLYVNARTYVAHYEAPVQAGEEPAAKIGLGSLGEAYGLALSRFPGTLGRLYVPDAADDVLEVYDPAIDLDDPVQVIDGAATPSEGFLSLRDAAVAVDRVSGDVYLTDDTQPQYTEQPRARVYAYSSTGTYEGHLKYDVITARPPGLAVDNSNAFTKGRVYVTSGNTTEAGVYAYRPEAATMSAPLPPVSLGAGGASAAGPAGEPALPGAKSTPAPSRTASAQASELAQEGKLRVEVSAAFAPRALPRKGTAPISASFSGRISSTDGADPPQLKQMRIELNRNGRLHTAGLPLCQVAEIQPASSERALEACRAALVGQGHFEANIVLSGQEPYPTRGRLLVFNAKSRGRPALLGQIYAAHPFATSFVIPFAIHERRGGTYGTTLTASLPKALGSWGYITAIEMTLHRTYTWRGKRHSLISAGCPAPKGFPGAVFPLARMSFGFDGGRELGTSLNRSCRARG